MFGYTNREHEAYRQGQHDAQHQQETARLAAIASRNEAADEPTLDAD